MTHLRTSDRLSHEAADAVETAAARQLEELLWQIHQRNVTDSHDCAELLSDWQVDECLVVGLDLSEQLALVEEFAEDYDLQLGEVSFDSLRTRIESLAAYVVTLCGADEARTGFETVEALLDELGLPLDAVLDGNPFEMFPHRSERDEADWHVYEYRDLEGEAIHADIWETELSGVTVYVRQWLEQA